MPPASPRAGSTTAAIIDTNPGYIKVGAKLLEDRHNLGAIGLATSLAKSSNVGMTKVALSLEPAQMYGTLTALGFGQVTTSGYPGESAGLLPHYSHWRPVGISSMSRGYGLSITPLQLAHAYATVAALGVSRPISFLRVETPPAGEAALDPGVSRMLIHLLEAVVAPDGGGKQAAIPGYTVAGKTGTAWKATAGGYATDRYLAVFGGIAPASNPRLAAVVIIDEPGAGKYYGGDVAAPVFAGVVGGALRLLAVPPDAPVTRRQRTRAPGGHAMNAAAAAPQSLARLLDGIAALPRDVAVSDLTQDGRAARPGGAFLAVRGSVEHGLKYAPQAVANGARAVLWEPAPVAVVPDLPSEILVAPVPRLREHASTIADRFFGAPSARMAVAGITGTNGKTTCAYLLAQALEHCGRAGRLHGHHRHGPPAAASSRAGSPPATPSPCSARWPVCAPAARPAWRWKFPRTRSTRRAWARCGSAPPRSPTSRAIISTITAPWRATAPPRRGCSCAKTWCRA